MSDLSHEEFWVLYLNRANKIVAREQISIGGIAGTVADSKLIFKRAIELLASSMILIHNHPSGNMQPSEMDRTLTRKLAQIGNMMEIPVNDHLIITERGYYSFADEGNM
jgi:DNA repair protein RadC